MKRMRKGLILTVTFLMVLGSFYFGSTQVVSAEPKSVLKMAIHWRQSADWNDPSLGTGIMPTFNMLIFHDSLLKPMPEGWYTPGVAESWTVSPDYKVYEFKLRKGVKFHNGDEMTADDVVFTFQRYKGGAAKLLKDRTEKLEAVNPYLFRITFKEPFLDFLNYFLPGEATIGYIVPKKYIEKVGDAEYKKHPIGLGPYKFVEFKPGIRLVGEAFKDFWRKEPNIKRLEFYQVGEAATRYAMVKKGEVDVATLMSDVFYKKVQEDPKLRMGEPPSPTSWTVYMAAQWDPKSPWSNPLVRKAASLALDKQLIADIHAPGAGAMGNFGLKGDPDNIFFPPDPYDPKQAKKLLAEAGYPNGFDGGTFYPFDGPYWPMGEQVANYWKAIGIKTNTVLYDRPTWFSKRRSGKMKGAVFVDAITPATIGQKLSYVFGPSGAYGKYDDIQAVWDKYVKSVDVEERKKLIRQVQKMYHDKTMFIHMVGSTSPAAIGPRVKGNPWKVRPLMWWVAPMEDMELNSYD